MVVACCMSWLLIACSMLGSLLASWWSLHEVFVLYCKLHEFLYFSTIFMLQYMEFLYLSICSHVLHTLLNCHVLHTLPTFLALPQIAGIAIHAGLIVCLLHRCSIAGLFSRQPINDTLKKKEFLGVTAACKHELWGEHNVSNVIMWTRIGNEE